MQKKSWEESRKSMEVGKRKANSSNNAIIYLHMPRPCQRHPYSRYDEKSQVFRAENVSVCLCLCHNKAAFIVLRLG